jgi:hypothetical protein
VILIAVVAFVIWSVWGPEPRMAHGLIAAVSVLIVLSLRAGAGHADVDNGGGRQRSQAGVLIRNAEALERLEKVDTLVVINRHAHGRCADGDRDYQSQSVGNISFTCNGRSGKRLAASAGYGSS